MKKIAFDLDGTITECWCKSLSGRISLWLLENFEGSEIARKFIRWHIRRLRVRMKPHGSFCIITARMLWMMRVTYDWLDKNDINPEFVTFVACNEHDPKKRAMAKVSVLKDQNIDVYYEDEGITAEYIKRMLPNLNVYVPVVSLHCEEVL